jgi:hypothetical protein
MTMARNVLNKTEFPPAFPVESLETVLEIGKRRSWYVDRLKLAQALWSLEGFHLGVHVGGLQPVGESSPDGQELANRLHTAREFVYKGLADDLRVQWQRPHLEAT